MSTQDSSESISSDPNAPNPPATTQDGARSNIIREMVETERKYVQDLEIMQVRLLFLFVGSSFDLA